MAEKVAVMKSGDFVSTRQSTEDLEKEIAELEAAHKKAREDDTKMADEAFAPDLDDNSDEEDTDEDQIMVEETEPDVEEESGESTKKSREESDGHDWKKRHGDLRRWSQEQINERDKRLAELAERLESLEGAAQQAEMMKGMSSPEDIAQFAETYPDFAKILKTYVRNELSTIEPTIEKKLKKVDEIDENIRRQSVVSRIMKAHPDMGEIKEDPKWASWLSGKSSFVQSIIKEGKNPDADAIIDVINMYKLETGVSSSKPKAKKEKSPAEEVADAPMKRTDKGEPKPKRKFKYSESMIERNSAEWYEENQADITQAIRDGQFLYDISGHRPTE